MRRFKSPGQAQRFLSIHGLVNNLFRRQRHLLSAANYRTLRDRDVVEAIQRSITSGANQHFTFGRYEKLIGHFPRNLHDCMGDTIATN